MTMGATNSSARVRWSRRKPCRSRRDRKSTRLNSSHLVISYAVFCLKKKKPDRANQHIPALWPGHVPCPRRPCDHIVQYAVVITYGNYHTTHPLQHEWV